MTKVYHVYFKTFHGPAIKGGFFLDRTEGIERVTRHRDDYVSAVRPSASTPNMQEQARSLCIVWVDEYEIGEVSVHSEIRYL